MAALVSKISSACLKRWSLAPQAAARRVAPPEKVATPDDELAILNAAISKAKAAQAIYAHFSQEKATPQRAPRPARKVILSVRKAVEGAATAHCRVCASP